VLIDFIDISKCECFFFKKRSFPAKFSHRDIKVENVMIYSLNSEIPTSEYEKEMFKSHNIYDHNGKIIYEAQEGVNSLRIKIADFELGTDEERPPCVFGHGSHVMAPEEILNCIGQKTGFKTTGLTFGTTGSHSVKKI
jgi:hypothetical protein